MKPTTAHATLVLQVVLICFSGLNAWWAMKLETSVANQTLALAQLELRVERRIEERMRAAAERHRAADKGNTDASQF